MKDQLIFDTTDADTIAASDSVGAYLRSSDGTLLTHTTDGGAERLDVNQVKLAHATDNVAIAQGGNTMIVNADGSINANVDVSVVSGSDKAEDSAHASGDIGTYILGVRQDTIANSTSNDGDYGSLKLDAVGALYVNVNSGNLTVSDAALANTAVIAKTNTLDAADTDELAVATALANRKYLMLYNFSNRKVYIGGAGVTAAAGFPLSPGSTMELRAGAASAVSFIGESGQTPEIRTLELS